MNYNIPTYAASLPWFMFDLFNKQLITSGGTVPASIADSKDIFLTETPIPGLNYSPIRPAGNGNRKISFTLPLVKRNNTIGNSFLIQQFKLLRNQAVSANQVSPNQFSPNPKVLYSWGTGSVPLEFVVKKCDLVYKPGWNQVGSPQFADVSVELWLDESSPVYKAEEVYRKASLYTGGILNGVDNITNAVTGRSF